MSLPYPARRFGSRFSQHTIDWRIDHENMRHIPGVPEALDVACRRYIDCWQSLEIDILAKRVESVWSASRIIISATMKKLVCPLSVLHEVFHTKVLAAILFLLSL